MVIRAYGNQIESISYTVSNYLSAGVLGIGWTYDYTPLSVCEVKDNSFLCDSKISKVYALFGPIYQDQLQCQPGWEVGKPIDVE